MPCCELEYRETTDLTFSDQPQRTPTIQSLYAQILWSKITVCAVVVFWTCTTQAEDSPGVWPSRWVRGLPSVVLPGEHNASDPVALRAKSGALLAAAEQSTQWPPGGEPITRVTDDNTVAVSCDSGLIPSGKLLPPDFKPSREFQARAQVRCFHREIKDGPNWWRDRSGTRLEAGVEFDVLITKHLLPT